MRFKTMRSTRRVLKTTLLTAFGALFYCEFLMYYLVLWQCSYPQHVAPEGEETVTSMILADTHLLGSRNGHWFDKLRREWQMHRSFQTAMTLFNPETVFILGDIFDEGKWCSKEEFDYYVDRFHGLFYVNKHQTKLYVVAGNHDIGFHYSVTPYLNKRFREAFKTKSVKKLMIKGIPFVLINSVAFEGDDCFLCKTAVESLRNVAEKLRTEGCAEKDGEGKCKKYVRPVLMTHYPLYRTSDGHCVEPDAAPKEERNVPFKEKWDCISKESTELLLDELKPRLVLSGHTHHSCRTNHTGGLPEWTVSSFSWRNKKNPSFLLAKFSRSSVSIEKCYMPDENTLYVIYVLFVGVLIVAMFKEEGTVLYKASRLILKKRNVN